MSKGSHPRPSFVSGEHYRSEHERIFQREPSGEEAGLQNLPSGDRHPGTLLRCICGDPDCDGKYSYVRSNAVD